MDLIFITLIKAATQRPFLTIFFTYQKRLFTNLTTCYYIFVYCQYNTQACSMLKKIFIRSSNGRNYLFIVHPQHLELFFGELKKSQRKDIWVYRTEDIDKNWKPDSEHLQCRYSCESGFSVISIGLNSTDGMKFPCFIKNHGECRDALAKLGADEFIYQAETAFFKSDTSQSDFDFTGSLL